MVPGENEDEVGHFLLKGIDILKDGIGCPLIPMFVNSLLGRDHPDEFSQGGRKDVPTQLDMTMKGSGFILGE